MLELKAIVKKRGPFTLGPLSLSIPDGITAIVGPNGAGKSTLLDILTGVLSPDSGSITFSSGHPGSIGYLPQAVSFPPRARALDYLEYVAWLWKLSSASAQEALGAVGLTDRANDRITSLSGGMQQRIGIAQAIIGNPTFLILDEPASLAWAPPLFTLGLAMLLWASQSPSLSWLTVLIDPTGTAREVLIAASLALLVGGALAVLRFRRRSGSGRGRRLSSR